MTEEIDMDTKQCTRTNPSPPDSGTTYKVWVEIEHYDEITGIGTNMDAPGGSLAEFPTFEEAYAFAESLQQTFEAQSPPSDPTKNPGPASLPAEVLDAIERILDYLFYHELKHCRCFDPENQSGHIFTSLVAVRNWIDGTKRSVNWWLNLGDE